MSRSSCNQIATITESEMESPKKGSFEARFDIEVPISELPYSKYR